MGYAMTARTPRHRRKSRNLRWRWPRQTLLTLLSVLAVAAYLLAPGMLQWNVASAKSLEYKNLVEQTDTPVGPSDPALVDLLRRSSTSVQAPPLILTYHDIGYNASRYTVKPEVFAAQMQLLHDAGWTTLTADHLVRWLHGEPMPAHSVVITFDDGARGVWRYADRILARNHQRALAFIITGFVGTHAPYYMTWPEITALQASGRWDLEAHTHLGHVQVPIDTAGGQAPFLTSLEYRPDQHRVETPDEYETRILSDLTECNHQFALHNLPKPALFAYPFSAHSDDPAADGILRSVIESLYKAAMLDVSDAISTTVSGDVAQGNISRMDVTADLTTEMWAKRLDGASPLDPSNVRPLADTGDWTDSLGHPVPVNIGPQNQLIIDPGPGAQLSRAYARFRTSMWNTYTMSVDLGGFSHPGDGTTAGLSVLAADPNHEVDLSISSGAYTVTVGFSATQPVAFGKLPDATWYHVDVVVTPALVIITIDGKQSQLIFLPPTALRLTGGGIGVRSHSEFVSSPPSEFANLTVH
jgi:poly-beta-1,6-N-acetyl-D-glucosamine N-deacetylase